MNTSIYCIKDEIAEIFLPPITFNRDNEAIRMFANCVNSPNHSFAKNPADYTLYKVGDFDNNKGSVKPEAKQIKLASGEDLVLDKSLQEPLPF